MKFAIKDKEGIPVKDAKITVLEGAVEVDKDKISDDKGEFMSSKVDFNVGSKVTLKISKENFKDTEIEVLIEDGSDGLFVKAIEFSQAKVSKLAFKEFKFYLQIFL